MAGRRSASGLSRSPRSRVDQSAGEPERDENTIVMGAGADEPEAAPEPQAAPPAAAPARSESKRR